MKTIFGTLFFLCATAAFSQNAPVLNNDAQPLRITDHPEHAAQHGLAPETSLLGGSSYSYAKGEVPLAEFASPIYETPLGDLARALKKERANNPKAKKVSEN
jgi:hypothetical protein